jgi:hypothetical protein
MIIAFRILTVTLPHRTGKESPPALTMTEVRVCHATESANPENNTAPAISVASSL